MELLKKLLFCVLAILLCSACTPKNGQKEAGTSPVLKKKELLRNTLFILGKDFYNQQDIFQHIKQVYSEKSWQSNVHILPYSNITAKTQQARTQLLIEYLEQNAITTIISLGIPEGYARSLITAKEKYPFLLIITLSPTEEHLLFEACSNIVIECTFTDNVEKLDWDTNEHDSHILLFIALITAENWYSIPEKNPIKQFLIGINTAKRLLHEWAPDIAIPAYTLSPFYDPEFNIPSYTHLMLSRSTSGVSTIDLFDN